MTSHHHEQGGRSRGIRFAVVTFVTDPRVDMSFCDIFLTTRRREARREARRIRKRLRKLIVDVLVSVAEEGRVLCLRS